MGNVQNDSLGCATKIEQGLRDRNDRDIEDGLSLAFDLFVDYLLDDRYECLNALGRDLNSVYFPYRSQATDAATSVSYLLGQLGALINLCDYTNQRVVPDTFWQALGQSKYAKPVLQTLLKNGVTSASDLVDDAGLPNAAQLSRTTRPMVGVGILRVERFGKNVWYSLTSSGRLFAAKHFGAESTSLLDAILPSLMAQLAKGRQSLNELANSVSVNIPVSVKRSLVSAVVSSLRNAGIVEEVSANWQLSSNLRGDATSSVKATECPELIAAASFIQDAYDRLRTSGFPDTSCIEKAKKTINEFEIKISSDIDQRSALAIEIALQKAKCAALDGDWQTALNLISTDQSPTDIQKVGANRWHWELETIWLYVQIALLEPLVMQAKRCSESKDYSRSVDALLPAYRMYAAAAQRFGWAKPVLDVLTLAISALTTARNSQDRIDRMVDEAIDRRLGEQLPGEQVFAGSDELERDSPRYNLSIDRNRTAIVSI